MAYSEAVLARARARLERARESAETEANNRLEKAYADCPRLREVDAGLRRTMAQAAAAAFSSGEDPRTAIERIRKENLALQEERNWLLQTLELEESDLEPQPVCTHCGGTGYVGSHMCECLRELCRQEQKQELSSLLAGRESFDAFRLDLYPDTPDPKLGVSCRRVMERVFGRCRSYARQFHAGAPNLLFSGGPGLGKTFLSACIARTVAEGGFSVVYDTAGKLFADFEAAKFQTSELTQSRTTKYLACDLLIMDDLGTEMTTQFTQSALYQVLNTRLMENRSLIVSTNLTPAELEERYSPQIVSRLLGSCELLTFCGNDIRMMT
ncbi:MAG: ATP-binding protein [Oscillospiraceae bacterium]|nr:ATP-binding protein [Oscillospiraceae bacterium]